MRVSIIAAMGRNRVIGTATGLPWHLPRDLKQFRALTLGKPVILGRTTFEHIGRPLPGRPNIVLTRQPAFMAEGIRVVHSVEEALTAARQEAEALGADEVMVIGGGDVYRAFLPLADRLYLTVVGGEFEGTATFPVDQVDWPAFTVTDEQSHPADAKNAYPLTFWRLDRAAGADPESGVPPAVERTEARLAGVARLLAGLGSEMS